MWIALDYTDRRPLYEQIVERVQELVLKGVLAADEQLPSVRNLAMELSINPNTIQRAYAELERQGVIYCIKGKGNFVSGGSGLTDLKKQELYEALKRLVQTARQLGVAKEELTEYIGRQYEAGGGAA